MAKVVLSVGSHPDFTLAGCDQIAVVEQEAGLEQFFAGGEPLAKELAEEQAERKSGRWRPARRNVGKSGTGTAPRRPIVPRRIPARMRMPQLRKTGIVPAIMLKPAASPQEPPSARVPRLMAEPISLPTSPPIRIVPPVIPRLLPR
jgi:hypothetical protein